MLDVSAITTLHREMVERWHRQALDIPYEGELGIICKQHSWNFLLWHEEDIARSPDVGAERIVEAKRNIDRYNQQRNDWIERVDDAITALLAERGIVAASDAPMNTETPGSSIDRLSILSLRIYHMIEQTERQDATADHHASVERKLAICREQLADLSGSAQQLVDDIFAGRKRHKTYRQLKMYNDPNLNPYLYQARSRSLAKQL